MTTLSNGASRTEHLPALHVLTVIAAASGSGIVWREGVRTAIGAGATVTIGPFSVPSVVAIEAAGGGLTYGIALVDFPTSGEAEATAAALIATAKAEAIAAAADDATIKADAAEAAAIAQAAIDAAAADWTIVGTIGDLCEAIGEGAPDPSVQATLDFNPAGDDNGLTFTAVEYGAAGNAISIEYVDPEAISAALSVAVDGNAITVNLATDTGTASTLTSNPAGDDNSLIFTAVDAGPDGDAISIEYVDPAANDAVLSVDVAGTAITVNLATNGAGAITSTAADILAEIEATPAADALVVVTINAADTGSGDDGSGVVTAMVLANLEGGAWGAITSTAADILAAIEADEDADALVAVTIMTGDSGSEDDGSGVVTAMAADNLEGGTGVGVGVAGRGSRYTDITTPALYINTGDADEPVWVALAEAD